MQRLAGDTRTIRTGQEHETRRDLARLTRSADRGGKLLLCCGRHRRRNQRGPYGTRRDSVDPNALATELVGETPGETDDGAFGGSIVKQVGAADVRIDGCIVDDRGTVAHVWNRIFGEVEERVDIGGEGVLPLGLGELGNVVFHHLVAMIVAVVEVSYVYPRDIERYTTDAYQRISILPMACKASSITALQFSFFLRSVACRWHFRP